MKLQNIFIAGFLGAGMNLHADLLSVAECTAKKSAFGLAQTHLEETNASISATNQAIAASQSVNAQLKARKAALDSQYQALTATLAGALEKARKQGADYAAIFSGPAALTLDVVSTSEQNLSSLRQRAQSIVSYHDGVTGLANGLMVMQSAYGRCAPPTGGLKKYWESIRNVGGVSTVARLEANYLNPRATAGPSAQEFSDLIHAVDVSALESYQTHFEPLADGMAQVYRQVLATHVSTCELAIQTNSIYRQYAPDGQKADLDATIASLRTSVETYKKELGI